MRLAVIADSHFHARSRWEECLRIHDWIAEDIARRDVDLIVHAGDVFETKSTPEERNAVAAWLTRCAAIAPVVIVRGNHDAVGDLSIFSKLETKHPITVEEGVGVHRVQTRAGHVNIGALAWPQVANLHAALAASSVEATGMAAGDCLRAVLRGMGQTLGELAGPRLLLAHAMVRGSRTSTGQPLVGCDLEIGLEDLALARADLVALGHIHMPQSWDVPVIADEREEHEQRTFDVVYPGSPRRTAFGEVEAKGYVIAELDRGGVQGWTPWERIATPCAPMLLCTARWENHCFHTRDVVYDQATGAEIRFRYTVAADERDAASAEAESMRLNWIERWGAADVKVEEEVIATGTARAPEIAAATSLDAKLAALWAARRDVPEEPRAARLCSMAHELEAA